MLAFNNINIPQVTVFYVPDRYVAQPYNDTGTYWLMMDNFSMFSGILTFAVIYLYAILQQREDSSGQSMSYTYFIFRAVISPPMILNQMEYGWTTTIVANCMGLWILWHILIVGQLMVTLFFKLSPYPI